ncbi:abnormal spindle-like microcephaly-associated protein homolog [Neophocaena asiaeorientalis asiaeorientalis]|uniref:Abnormal spindle-like microcephaly-associated protein homolog n=1 Tax=Neophocaena asiaeorientalis asiaeorientalis TaxID=1706337 RepID=A0A341CYN1_NEOAA|nr:abnormal spindle-like microcephaly-associated protein homolog [Neophocaena asiaeorientalis asiaeorientalis]
MATRRRGRDRWERSPPEPRPRVSRAEEEAASPPVLSLSHFCRSPFLCFGDVRLGASRTLPLALDNPNEETTAVRLSRGPAAECGFTVWPSAFVLQPKEKIVISITWTPLKGGRVREIVTFLVNDVLKHQAILLGNAEEPKKKKRSLWDTINKKKVSASSGHNQKISNIQNVDKTFNVSSKFDRVRSPLQACENLATNESCSPTENNSLNLEENKIPISPISPTFQECHGETCLPVSVHQSTTYTSLPASENGEVLKVEGANIVNDFHFNETVITETSFDSINNLSGQIEENSKLTLTPNYSSTLNITQSQGNFLSPDSFVNNSRAANNERELVMCLSPGMCVKGNSRPVILESKSVCEIYRTILSPDSFINDNYGLNQDLESESINPILSPNQFLKDNMAYICVSQQTCKLSPLSNVNSQASQPSQDERKNEVLPCIPECQCSKSPKATFEESKALEMKSNCYTFKKRNQPKFSAVQDISSHNHDKPLKRRPILSATVTKRKPTCARENQTEADKPKAKRCLSVVVGECEKETDDHKEKGDFHSFLPARDLILSRPKSCKNVITPPSKVALVARKRKSEGNTVDANLKVTVTEYTEVQEIKRIHYSPVESKTSTVKNTKKVITSTSKCISNREKLKLKKKTESLGHRTPNFKKNKKTKPIVPVAQSNLTFIKPLKTGIPRHPMPFAAKNMFYDERWKEKQEQGFTWWLNFILTPDDFTVKTNISEVNASTLLLGLESQHKISVPRAPTKDEVSLRAYTARCNLNRLRRAACRLFTSEKMVKAMKKLEIEIEARRLIVRKDRHLWKDVGERQKVLNWLLSYNPLWLRIGLETIYGELIPLEDNSDITGLAMFILNRLLWNPDIAAEYRHPTVPHLYGDGHEEALSKFTLKKLLLLVCFLDYAKISRLIDHDPCLFCKDAEFKASKEILLAFSRNFLGGEGDLSRHLSFLGLPVNHVQTPFDEFDFAVTNLAVDLQCGVRLVRTMELLTRNWNLSKKLRIPAISRLQKMHNVDIVLEVLKSRGIQLNDEHGNTILSKDIVDRHKEKTLALLWKIVLAFQVDISLNLDQLKEEIDFLKHTQSMKRKMSALSCHSDAVISKKKDKRHSGHFEQYSESVKLLMDWVNAVCDFYNKKVENFTVSFSDGRVLCYLIHHYHPCYVRFAAICQRTTQTVECTQTGSVVLNSSSESDESSLDLSLKALDQENTSELYKELLENEKKNFQLVRSAARDLGGIPAMIHHSDMSNTIPDEKVVITYLSFLCARLLDLRKETRAARLIQTTWRKYKLKKDLKRHQKRDKAARIIQSAVINFLTKRRFKKEVNAALVIQKYWRRLLAKRKLLMLKKEKLEKVQNKSASVIQRYWRRYSTRKQFLKLKYYSIILQSRIRMIIAVASYKRYLWAAVTIQRHWRACSRRKQDQQRYEMLRSSTLIIQSAFRRWRQRKMQLQTEAAITLQRAFRERCVRKQVKEEKAAMVIQSWYRMQRELRKYIHIRSCVVIIQTRFRCFQAQKLYKRKKESILSLQKYYKAYLKGKVERTSYLQKRAAAIRLQAAFRGMKARKLRKQITAACVFQSYWRMRQDRLRFLNLKKNIIRLQAHIRKHQQLQKYKKMKKAALVIQIHFRAYISAKKVLASYQKTRSAVIVLQSAFRGVQARKKFIYILTSVIRIQSYYRAYVSRKNFLRLKNAAVKLQSIVKMKQTRKQYLHLRAAALKREEHMRASCIKLQAFVRGYLVRKQVRLQRKAAVSLQSHFRMRKMRLYYLKIYKATVVIQSYYRAYKAQVNQRKNFLQVKRAVICLQATYRGYKVRQLIKQQSTAALKIQTAFRGYSKRMKYQSVLQSTLKIQRWYRTHKTASDIRTHFLKTRAAVISLQSAYRGWKVRKQIRREHQAAVKIQSAFRMAKAQKEFGLLKTAASVIQQHLRARAAGRRERLEHTSLRLAAVMLQSTWRGRAARRQVQKQHKCAVLIQSCYRMYVQRKKWKIMKKAACLIQMYYRAYSTGRKQHHLYLETKAAVVILQSAYRGMRVRKKIKEHHKAAAAIQSSYRAYQTKKKYATYRASAVIIQRWYRDTKIADRQRKEYLTLKKAAVKIQAVYRGVTVRRQTQHLHAAATLIQAVFKMQQSRRRYHQMRTAAVIIQVRYRAYHQGRTQRAKYLTTLKAVTILQASFRGGRVRQTLRRMQTAATLIQSHYRRHRQQVYFNKLKKVTRLVQQKYRAVRERNIQFQRYNKLRHSVICIQAAFRGMEARRHLKVMHSAAAMIQRRFRTLMMRRRFLSLRNTAVWIQRKYRANVCAKHRLQQLLRLQKAALKIQSWYRGWVVRKKVQEMHRAATVLQAAFRRHRAHVRYQAWRHASRVIQQQYRASRAKLLQRQLYLQQRHSAVVLQAAFRGMQARRHLKRMHASATLIQSRFRSLVMRKRFLSLKRAAIFVQRKYRATICAKHHLHQFLELQKAAITIQPSYRRLMAKKKLQEMHRAAALIQATFRMHRTHLTFQTWKHASILIQQHYRAYRAAKLQREHYVQQRHSAVVIQAAYKGMKARQLLREKHRAAVIIQSTYRMYRQYFFYQKLQWATKVIQERYRANKKKALQHNALKKAATCVQADFQDMIIRREIQEKRHQAAITLQKHFRAFKTRKHHLHFRAKAVFVQRRYRTLVAVQTQAVICIQSYYRGFKARRGIQLMHLAATRIQSFYRMYRARMDYQAKRMAIVVIQSYYRSYARVKMERKKCLAIQKSVRPIQAAFSGMKVRQKFKNMPEVKMAVPATQSAFCCHRTETQYEAGQSPALTVQRQCKASLVGPLQEAEYPSERKATVTIQKAFRKMVTRRLEKHKRAAVRIQSFLQMAVYRRRFIQQKRAAVTLQRHFRKRQTRKQFSLYGEAAVVLQNHHRAFLSAKRQREVYLQIRSSVIVIQARMEGFIQKRKFQKIKDSTIKIQTAWRRHKARKYLREVKAACKIQAWYRCWKARKDYLAVLRAVRIIQGCFCTKLQRRRFLNVRASTIIIQRKWRAVLSGRTAHEQFLMTKGYQAACLIQANFRGYNGRRVFLQQKSAALTIQRYIRARKTGKCERIKYVELKKSTVVLQALVRGWLVRKRILEQRAKIRLLHFTAAAFYHLSALRIQRAYRLHRALKNADDKQVNSAICIQRWFRARLQHKRFLQKHRFMNIQNEAQERMSQQNRAASVIQKAVRRFLLRKKQEKLNNRVTKIQALWRGYSWRKKNDCTKIKAIRQRLQCVNREIREENKLYHRTALALHYLLTYKYLSAILEALKHLEVVTGLSSLCCENMAQSGAISKIFVLIRSCNRSVPCMEVIGYAVQVLLNVAKYEKTTSAVYDVENCVDTLLELLQMYQEKPGDKVADKSRSIFTKTCCLLAVLLKRTNRASDVRSRSKVVDRIYSLYKLTAHKHKVNTERILCKQKKKSMSISFIPETPVRTRMVSRLKPDWVLRRDNLEEIMNPLKAIQMVMDTLGIPY